MRAAHPFLDAIQRVNRLGSKGSCVIGQAAEYLARRKDRLTLLVITRAEVLPGFFLEREPLARGLLDRSCPLEINIAVADLASRLRRERCWKMPEAFQAALAAPYGLRLAACNAREFSPEQFSLSRFRTGFEVRRGGCL